MYPLGRIPKRLGLTVQTPVAKLSLSLKTPSEKRAAAVMGPVVAAANGGNLNAVAILDTRRSIGIGAERAVWSSGYNQVLGSVLQTYLPQRGTIVASIPASAQSSPEAAASWALNTPQVVKGPSIVQKIADVAVPALLDTEAGQEVQNAVVSAAVKDKTQAAVTTAKSWLLPVALGLGFFFLKGKK